MDRCRVCLESKRNRGVCDIKFLKNLDDKSFIDVILFCLDIKIIEDSNINRKICMKCYKKIIAFYKFKTLALKNDIELKSEELTYNNEADYHNDEMGVKLEAFSLSDNEEIAVKSEEQAREYQSDDELLSVIKSIKYESFTQESAENNKPVKRGRGRPKKKKMIETNSTTLKQVCEECGKSVKNLKEHMQRHLPADRQRRIQCDRCDKTFSCHSAKYKHVRRKHLGIKLHCTACNKMVTNLKQHVLVVHNTEDLPYECIACQRRFISKSRLDQHLSVHTKDRPHECKTCGKRFRTKPSMLLHIRQVHDKEKTHLCQFCSKSFFKKYHLQVHLRSHTKEKPYSCPQCGKSFASTTILKNHQLIHGDNKMFSCTLCDMSFVRSGYLRSHMVSHTKEKRYPCQYCDVKFHRSDHRKRHEYTAHQRHLAIKTDT